MKLNMAPLLLLLPLLISACDSQQPTYSASNASSAAPPPQPAAQTPPPPPAAVPEKQPEAAPVRPAPVSHELVRARPMPERPEPLPPVNAIGIGGCDDFINRYRACVNTGVANGTIPVSRRPVLVRTFNVQVRQWQADLAAGKTNGLVTSCAEADKKARPELVKVGCSSF